MTYNLKKSNPLAVSWSPSLVVSTGACAAFRPHQKRGTQPHDRGRWRVLSRPHGERLLGGRGFGARHARLPLRAAGARLRKERPGRRRWPLLSLAGDVLEWACIGDSAFAVLRGSKGVLLSTPPRHFSLRAAGAQRAEGHKAGLLAQEYGGLHRRRRL